MPLTGGRRMCVRAIGQSRSVAHVCCVGVPCWAPGWPLRCTWLAGCTPPTTTSACSAGLGWAQSCSSPRWYLSPLAPRCCRYFGPVDLPQTAAGGPPRSASAADRCLAGRRRGTSPGDRFGRNEQTGARHRQPGSPRRRRAPAARPGWASIIAHAVSSRPRRRSWLTGWRQARPRRTRSPRATPRRRR